MADDSRVKLMLVFKSGASMPCLVTRAQLGQFSLVFHQFQTNPIDPAWFKIAGALDVNLREIDSWYLAAAEGNEECIAESLERELPEGEEWRDA
jgi:hypothetical protein